MYYFVIIFLVSILIKPFYGELLSSSDKSYCYSEAPTSELEYGNNIPYPLFEPLPGPLTIRGCEAKKVWILLKHGTKYPTADELRKLRPLIELHKTIISSRAAKELCKSDLDMLANWKWNISNDETIAYQGYNDLEYVGLVYARMFPELFHGMPKDFRFEFTPVMSTQFGCRSFLKGAFGSSAAPIDLLPAQLKNLIVYPQKSCNEYMKYAQNLNGQEKQISSFYNSPTMNQLRVNVSRQIGLNQSLTFDELSAAHLMCSYEHSWNRKGLSPWCSIFTPEQMKILSYYEDLKSFYKVQKSMDLNITCFTMADMIYRLGADDAHKVTAYFTHGTLILSMLQRLGMFDRSEILTSKNHIAMEQHRQFNGSEWNQLGANLAAIKYECAGRVEPEKVMFLFNHRRIMFDWCTNGLCDWSMVLRKYGSTINCQENFCRINDDHVNDGGVHSMAISMWNLQSTQLLWTLLAAVLIRKIVVN